MAVWAPPPDDVSALAAVALKKGCSRMRCRWATGLRHAALQVRDSAGRAPAARRRPRKRKEGLWLLGLLQASGVRGTRGREWGVTVVGSRVTWVLSRSSIPGKWPGARQKDPGLLHRRGKKIRNDHNTCIVRERGACPRELSTVYRLSE